MDLREVTFDSLTGLPTEEFSFEIVRELDETDLAVLGKPMGRAGEFVLTRLGQRHHALAKALALGIPASQAAIQCGYSPSHVSTIRSSQAFQELLKVYENDANLAYADMQQMLAGLGLEAAHELRERLEENPKGFKNNELLGIVEKTADRTGNGPVTTQNQNHLHVHMASRLEEARKRIAASKVVELEVQNGDP